MAGVTVRDLIDLAVGENDSANAHVTQVFQWRYEQAMTLARSLAGAGSALLIGLAVALAQEAAKVTDLVMVLGLLGALVIVTSGVWTAWHARRIHKQYVAAQFLLAELQTIRPFLRRYFFGGGS